jgi:hypothetical protein
MNGWRPGGDAPVWVITSYTIEPIDAVLELVGETRKSAAP